MGKFIIPAKKRRRVIRDTDCAVKVSADTYNALVEMSNESTLSFREIASRAILFAAENVEYQKEGD